jgi:hypothetical protein
MPIEWKPAKRRQKLGGKALRTIGLARATLQLN